MKSIVRFIAAAILVESSAEAATVGLRWEGQPRDQILYTGGLGVAQVRLDLLAGESVSGLTWTLRTDSWYYLYLRSASGPSGWSTDFETGGLYGSSIATLSPGSVANLTGPASQLIAADFEIMDWPPDGTIRSVVADFAGQPFGGVLNERGTRFHWDARYNNDHPGYIAYGDWGNPGWGQSTSRGHQPTANPLYIMTIGIPEPVTTAYGGFLFVVLCTRRRTSRRRS